MKLRPGILCTLLTSLCFLAAGCGDDGGGDTPSVDATPPAVDAPAADAAPPAVDAAPPAVDAAPPDGDTVPSNSADLFVFLQSGGYSDFPAESAVHDSSGPHGMVRTFVNETLRASLEAGNAAHPKGAASVKELYESDGTTLSGWAVSVKTDDDSDNGNGWYWYEVFSVTDGSDPPFDGNGLSTCTGCHSDDDAVDYIRVPFPLQ